MQEVVERDENGRYACTCPELIKTGFPCAHMIELAKQMEFNLYEYVLDRWKH